MARHRRTAILVVGLASLLVSVTASAIHFPVPSIHDEFSYLLMADTFAQGRVTNPTHPGWKGLESFHIIQQPTYASKYPPAQGIALAIGQVAFGHPLVGVWLATAFACAVTCWMLQGWVPARWAFWGGLLVATFTGIQFSWGQSYWGGCVAMAGGALLFGALPRLLQRPALAHALCLACGLIILANSRPFEGLLVSLPVALLLLGAWIVRGELLQRDNLVKVVLPVTTCLMVAGAAMGYYNVRVTGHALKMPYQVYQHTYSIGSVFAWPGVREEPEYGHAVMRDFYRNYGLEKRREQTTLIKRIAGKKDLFLFFRTSFVIVPLIALPWVLRRRKMAFVAGVLVLVFAATLTVYACHAHYFAPAAPLVILVAVQGLRYLRVWGRYRRTTLGWLLPVMLALHTIEFLFAAHVHAYEPTTWAHEREAIRRDLEQLDGRHLVLVRYAPDHCPHDEWVYNRADLDSAKVVWAREMSRAENLRLMHSFPDRKLWLLNADLEPRTLVPCARVDTDLRQLAVDGKSHGPHGAGSPTD
jgi:hypothetical protein